MDYHVRISANIIIKRVVNETDTLSSLASSSESMVTEPSTIVPPSNLGQENDTGSSSMDYDDQESYIPSRSESSLSSESMITDEDSNDSSSETNSNLYQIIEPISHSSATSNLLTNTQKRTTISKRAGLIFPVKRLYNKIKSKFSGKRVSIKGCIELAGVLEYLTAELLDISGNVTYAQDKSIIIPRHMFLAVQEDKAYKLIFNHVTLPECGTLETNLPRK